MTTNLTRAAAIASLVVLAACGGGGGRGNDEAMSGSASSAASASPAASAPPKAQIAGKRTYSFVERFGEARLNSLAKASTPTGRGALVLPVAYGPAQIKTVTVLASFRCSFRLSAKAGDVLAFEAAKPYAIGGPVAAFIDESTSSGKRRIFQEDLPPASASGPTWVQYQIKLEPGPQTITFGADVAANNGDAAWASFADPAIYSTGR